MFRSKLASDIYRVRLPFRRPHSRCCLQVNLALKKLPRFRCLPEPIGQHRTTTHLLPDESVVMQSLTQGFNDVQAGRLPEFPTIEWYFHTTNDPSIQVSRLQEGRSAVGLIVTTSACS